jgi:hypothetical protein
VLAPLGDLVEVYWVPYVEEVVGILAAGWPRTGKGPEDLPTVLRLVVDFYTWQSLSRAGMEDERAAELVVRMVEGVTGAVRTR